MKADPKSWKHLLCIAVLAAAIPAFACPACDDSAAGPDSARAAFPVPATERLKAVFPGFDQTRELTEPFRLLSVHAEDDSLLGYIADSDHAGTTTEGYAGPVPVLAYLAPDGRILDFDVLRNRETPGYLAIALNPEFRGQMKAWRPGQDEPVDAVSLATITSVALIESLTGLVSRLDRKLINPDKEP